MKLSIVTCLLLLVASYSSALNSVKSPSLLHHFTGRIPSSKLVPAPLRHVLSLLGLRGRKVLPSKSTVASKVLSPSVLSMSPFAAAAAATNVRPVYTPHVMMSSNHRPHVTSGPSTPSNGGFHFNSQVLPPFLGDPSSDEPRLSFVPLPSSSHGQMNHHSHHQLHHQMHHQNSDGSLESFGQMLPSAAEKQQVMYIYVDEEGKTVSTKVTDPHEGKNILRSIDWHLFTHSLSYSPTYFTSHL